MVVALILVGVIGIRVLERDRDAMHDRFAQERMQGLEEAARALASDTKEIGEDLDLAATLLDDAESRDVADRELHAIATIKREYLVVEARSLATTTRVVALNAPSGIAKEVDRELTHGLDAARQKPNTLYVSPAVVTSGNRAPWYRIFARQHVERRHAVAVVVDTTILLSRLKLVRDRASVVLVLGTGGAVAPSSNPRLAALAETDPALRAIIARTRNGQTGSTTLDGDRAATLDLSRTTAIAVAVPLHVDRAAPWTLLVVSSNAALEAQEETLVRRVIVLGFLVLTLLLAAAAYVIHNARRAATLRERLHHVDRLAHLTEKAEKIVDNIPSGVLTLSDDHRITSANRWFRERHVADVEGRRLDAAFDNATGEQIATLTDLVHQATSSGAARSLHRARLGLLGHDALFSVHAIPLARGISDVRLLLVFDDLTEQRRIEEQLLHSEKLVTAGQLAAGIAHEVGTPLNIARGRAELLKARAAQADAANHQIIIDQIDRVTRLIQQLLDFVRPSATTIQVIDLGSTMQVITELLAPEAGKRKVSLRLDTAPGLPVLRADPDRLQQVLVNLVMNGIDACDEGGHVELRATSRAGALVMEVADDGQGIPHELQAQIFDPFFTTKKRGQGTGLGLWVVAQLVRSHAGEIELDSAPGAGTTVRITWPHS
jgi:signal transduction histidine kinase